MEPRTFEIEVTPGGEAMAGYGLLAAFVPAGGEWPSVLVMGIDPRHDPGRPIEELAPAALQYLRICLHRDADDGPVSMDAAGRPADWKKISGDHDPTYWTVIDNWGRFFDVEPRWPAPNTPGVPTLEFNRFPSGAGIEAFLKETGGSGEAAIELLSALVEAPCLADETPSMRDFLDSVEVHGNLPAPGIIFNKVAAAAEDGDARKIAEAIQPDPVISSSLVNSANAARFAAAGKTGSVPQAVVRLGTSFVRRVVFVAEMVARFQRGACSGFDYKSYWRNAIATGAAARGLMEKHGIPERYADDVFMAGLVSGIGWLVVAETFPGLMAKYLDQCKEADPITKARAQNEIFPCPIRLVSERYLARFEFPETIRNAIGGKPEGDRTWYDCLASAMRASQGLSPFNCLAIPTTIPVPDSCREEWERWKTVMPI